jgi:TolA-binding protein
MREVREDKLQQYITKIVSLYYHQRQKFFIGVGAIVAVIIIVPIVFANKGKENPEVQLRFTEALGIYSMASSNPANLDQAEERFTDFTRRFGGNYLSAKAHFYLGNINYQRQEYEKARKEFERAYGKLKGDPVLGPATLFAIGNCFEEQQNFKKSAQIYEQVYDKYKKSAIAAEALISSGRCYKQLNDLVNAGRIYNKAVKDLPPGETAEQAKAELAYLKAIKDKF